MKKVYYKPEITMVAVNERQALLNTSTSGPNSDYMYDPTISGWTPVREYNNVWDERF